MKKILCLMFTFAFLPAFADDGHSANYTAKIIAGEELVANQPFQIVFSLHNPDGKPVSIDDLEVVHTKKVHALVIDPSLTDYQHLHPSAAENDGEYSFDFTPKLNADYRIWIDITPKGSKQQYIMLDLKAKSPEKAEVKKEETLKSSAKVGDKTYNFELKFDGKLVEDEAVMGKISVTTEDGEQSTNLEPVMGAFSHIVGFSDDYESIAHLHPMGVEPKTDEERGGPELMFHLSPKKPGFLKLFGQFKIDGCQVFVPFGVFVEPKKYLSDNL